MITLEGTLARDAEYRTVGLVAEAVVLLTVDTGTGCPPFEVKVPFGSGPGDHTRARAQASLLRRGAPATVVAQRMRWCDDHGEARFIATFCDRVTVNGGDL